MTLRRILVMAVVALGMVLTAAGPAAAHGTLVRSDPADASVLEEAPSTIELTFNEPISVDASAMELIDVDGTAHNVEIIGHGATEATLVLRIGDLPDGLYSLRWSAFSTSDGHVTRGMLVWGFGPGADLSEAAFAESAQPTAPFEILFRWALMIGIALVLGGFVIETLVLAPLLDRLPSTGEAAWHRAAATCAFVWMRRGAVISSVAAVLLITHQLWIVATSSSQGVVDLLGTSLLSTTWGRWALVRLLALVTLALVSSTRSRGAPERRTILIAIGAAIVAHAATGHAAATDTAVFSVANDAVHLVSAAAWLGGVFVLWRVLQLRGARRLDRVARESLTLFSTFAAGAVAIAVITGFLAVGDQIRSIDALILSLYGRALLAKLAILGATLFLAFATRRGISGPLQSGRIGREAGAGVALILSVAFLTAAVPSNGTMWRPVVEADARQLATVQDDMQLALTITPNLPGQNLILVDAASTRRPVIAPIDRVLVRIETLDIDVDSITVDVEPTDRPGEYEVPTTQFAVSGAYRVEVVVRRTGLPDVTTEFDWGVASAPSARATVLSAARIGPWTSTAGAVGAGLFLVFVFWQRARISARDRRFERLEFYLTDKRRDRVGP